MTDACADHAHAPHAPHASSHTYLWLNGIRQRSVKSIAQRCRHGDRSAHRDCSAQSASKNAAVPAAQHESLRPRPSSGRGLLRVSPRCTLPTGVSVPYCILYIVRYTYCFTDLLPSVLDDGGPIRRGAIIIKSYVTLKIASAAPRP